MPVIYFIGDRTSEQAIGPKTHNGIMQAYAIRRDDPLNMIYLGGHRIEDAPSYNITEGVIVPEYRFLSGRNVVVETQITEDRVKGVSFNLMLPNRVLSVTDRIYQLQSKCDFDLALVPFECGSGCDEYFYVAEAARFGAKQITNAVIGYDDQEAPITTMRTVKTQGQLLSYYGLEVRALTAAPGPLYAVAVVDEEIQPCQGCDCPYQIMARAGGDGVAAPFFQSSLDGGNNWIDLDTTALPVGSIITTIAGIGGRGIFGYSDVVDGTGTLGGVGYVNELGVLVVSPIVDQAGAPYASLGIQSVIEAGGRLYAFGTNGEVLFSCDEGLNWTQLNNPMTQTVIAADYDKNTGVIYLGGTNGAVWAWDFNAWVDLTPIVNLGAVDVTDVDVTGNDQLLLGTSTGIVVENFSVRGGGAWTQTAAFANAVQASAGDRFNYRSIVASGNQIVKRDLNSFQRFEALTTLTGNVTAMVAGFPLLDEGENAFWAVTDDGEMVRLSACGLCIESGLCA